VRRGGYLSCDAAADARDRLSVPRPGDPGGRVLTVADWLETWAETRVRLRDSTRRNYRGHIRLYLRRLFDGVLLAELHVGHVEMAFRRLFAAQGRQAARIGVDEAAGLGVEAHRDLD